MANPADNLNRTGRKAQGGRSYQVSAYLMPEHQALFERLRSDLSSTALSRRLGEAIVEILRDEGYRMVACPQCGAVHVERDVVGGLNDDWMCPTCRHLTSYADWREVPAQS